LLGRSAAGTVNVRVFARPTTVTIQLNVRVRDPRPQPAYLEDHEDPETLPAALVRPGVRFADGRVATNLPGAFWMADEDGPLFLDGFERGDLAGELPEHSRSVYALRWVLWPVPPPGPFVVACAWPARGIAESSVVLEGDAIRAASEASAAAGRDWPAEPEEPAWWAQRSGSDEPIAWSITAWLRPPGPVTSRADCDPVVAGVVERARVEHWDGDDLDGWLAEYEAARHDTAPRTDFGWMGFHRGAYRLELTEVAATEAAARAQAGKRLAQPEGRRLTLDVVPTDAG